MVKDASGKELRENDTVEVELVDSHILGVVKDLRIAKGKRKGFMRIAFQFEVPIDSESAVEGIKKLSSSSDYGEAFRVGEAFRARRAARLRSA